MTAIPPFSHYKVQEVLEEKIFPGTIPNFGIFIYDGNGLIFSIGNMKFENDPTLCHLNKEWRIFSIFD